MPLDVIGAGFGRTGTMSLKVALEQLGLGPCFHMIEVMGSPDRPTQWHAQVTGSPPGWEVLFEGYRATVDWPACAYWEELAAAYPDAKVILSVRDSVKWHDSVMNTIYNVMSTEPPAEVPDFIRTGREMTIELIFEQTFGGKLEDRAHAISVYEQHNQRVMDAVPAERLLVYEVADGWDPLCAFLERPVPEGDFPRLNDTAEFRARMGLPPVA